jgi:C-5 cytosine-specific DNA methylase
VKPATTAYTQILKPKQTARCADLQDVPKQRRLKIKQATTSAALNATRANLNRQQPARWKNGARNLRNGATKGNEMRILALFDDGNGSVKKALPEHDVVSVGIGNADIVMDLADMKNIKKLVDMHKTEPFDLLMASPPCESWSFATATRGGGNAYRDKETLQLRTFENWKTLNYPSISKLVKRNAPEVNEAYSRYLRGGVNGDLTALFVCELVKVLEIPFVIENPQASMLFERMKRNGLNFIKNKACYSAYSDDFPLKRTGFASSVLMNLKNANKAAFRMKQVKSNRKIHRSAIPADLIREIVSHF